MINYIKSKQIKLYELKNKFKLVKKYKLKNSDLNACGNCGDDINVQKLPSESWMFCLYY